MNALIWKEWRQQRWLVLAWCGAGIIMPILEAMITWTNRQHISTDSGSGIVIFLGVLFAIILAAATTGQEVQRKQSEFWQSRPVSARKLFFIKYLWAAILLCLSFVFISTLDFATLFFQESYFDSNAWVALCVTWPLAVLLFGATMFLMVLIRDSAKASLLAIWFGLMVYFLPLMTGGLGWLNVFERFDHAYQYSFVARLMSRWLGSTPPMDFIPCLRSVWQEYPAAYFGLWIAFVLFCGLGSAVFLCLTSAAVRRNWRWRPGQKSIAWLIGLSAMFIFGVSMRQVGHNLIPVTLTSEPVTKQMHYSGISSTDRQFNWTPTPSPSNYSISPSDKANACIYGNICYQSYLLRCHPKKSDRNDTRIYYFTFSYFPVSTIGSDRLAESTSILYYCTGPTTDYYGQNIVGFVVRKRRAILFYRPAVKLDHDTPKPIRMLVIDLRDPDQPKRVLDEEIASTLFFNAAMATVGNYCYISMGEELLVLSLDQPDRPEIVQRISPSSQVKCNYCVPCDGLQIAGNRLLCRDSFRIMMFDISQPANPRMIFEKDFAKNHGLHFDPFNQPDTITAATVDANVLYTATITGLKSYRLVAESDGQFTCEPIGYRRATPLEQLAGRRPMDLFFYKGWLVENAGGFGVLVYDVSDPTRPRRAYHGMTVSYVQTMGIWQDKLYTVSTGNDLTFFQLPPAQQQ